MNTNKRDSTQLIVTSMLMVAALFFTTRAAAIDLVCIGPQMGEIFVDTATGKITKSADESLTVVITTENSNYGFLFKGKTSQFKATINRANGQITLDDACTPQCWSGPIFGTCTPVKAKY
jgi:hypothetical protein